MMFIQLILSVLISSAAPAAPLKPYVNKKTDVLGATSTSFPANYIEAREAFREIATPAIKDLNAKVGAYKIPSRIDSDLTIDHIYLPAPEKSDRLVVMTSGVHGTEAYAGHAVQLMLLKEILANRKNYPFNILMIHGLNPYGFKYFRRGNENNVDLNRNFATNEQFKSENKAYKKLRRLFNPPGQANAMWVSQTQFYLAAFWNKLIRGKKAILQGLGGQYQDSGGPFYGGNTQQAETIFAQYIIKQYGSFPSKIYYIDLHTGFGEKGRLHFIVPAEAQAKQSGYFMKLFEGFDLNTGNDKDFYPTTGDISDWAWKSFPDKTVLPVTFEMGTMDSQTTMGGIRSLWITVVENQGRQRGFNSKQSEITNTFDYEELFNPQSREWQEQYIQQAKAVLDKTLERFKTL